jgi:hypothetical protein
VLGGDVGSGLKVGRMGGHVGRKVGGVVVQYLVLMMVVDIRPWRGEVQGWLQVCRGLSYVRLVFC